MNITKIIKNNFLALVAFATVIGFSAFKISHKTINQPWYYVSGNPTEASSYSGEPIAECGDLDEVICEILAPDNGSGRPNMEAQVTPGVTVRDQINQALSGTPSTNTTVQSFRSQ